MPFRLTTVLFMSCCFFSACQKKSQNIPENKAGTETKADDFHSKNFQKNAELLQELIQVVMIQKSYSKAEFLSLVSALNQGGSLIGMYNSLAHSQDYRDLEKGFQSSTEAALDGFAKELFEVQKSLSVPTRYERKDRDPLPPPQFPTGDVEVMDFSKKKNSGNTAGQSVNELKEIFRGASIFTLKRVLGDELLRLIDELKPEELARWYGKWAVHFSSYSVPLGLKLRSEGDAAFHESWAKKANKEQISWEALNRVHRVLNELGRGKENSGKEKK